MPADRLQHLLGKPARPIAIHGADERKDQDAFVNRDDGSAHLPHHLQQMLLGFVRPAQVVQLLLDLGVEAGVLDGDGRLVGQGPGQPDLPRPKIAPITSRSQFDQPDHPAIGLKGQHEEAFDPSLLHKRPLHRVGGRIVGLDDDGNLLSQHPRRRRVIRQGVRGLGDVIDPGLDPLGGVFRPGLHRFFLGVVAGEDAAFDPDDAHQLLGRRPQDRLQFQPGEEGRSGFDQRRQVLGLAPGLHKEVPTLDDQRRLPGQSPGPLEFLRGEGAGAVPLVDLQEADHLVADHEGEHQVRLLPHLPEVGEFGRVGRGVVGADGDGHPFPEDAGGGGVLLQRIVGPGIAVEAEVFPVRLDGVGDLGGHHVTVSVPLGEGTTGDAQFLDDLAADEFQEFPGLGRQAAGPLFPICIHFFPPFACGQGSIPTGDLGRSLRGGRGRKPRPPTDLLAPPRRALRPSPGSRRESCTGASAPGTGRDRRLRGPARPPLSIPRSPGVPWR